jgi:hypothetical protein
MAFFKFICTECGHRDSPCPHFMDLFIQKELKFLHGAVLEIIHLLNRPTSALLHFVGDDMTKTIAPGGTAQAVFQEWTGPNGTGDVVPNAGPISYTSDNTSVATVDPSTGAVTGVAAGTCNISGQDTVNNLAASDVLTVLTPPPPAVSATLQLQ